MSRWLTAVLIVVSSCAAAPVQVREWGPPQDLCKLDDLQIDESSGVAASHRSAGVFFTHNDSGDKPRFFRFKRDGSVDGVYELANVSATDWEDMESAVIGDVPYLFLADFGDNARRRSEIVIYRVVEPKASGTLVISDFETYTITYPDKPHDCEALIVDPATGDLYLVTKARDGVTGVYRLNAPSGSGTYKLQHMRDIPVDTGGLGGTWVTAGSCSPDGKYVVLRTYTGALEYEVGDDFASWADDEPAPVRLAIEVQGEAICYSKDGRYLITTSERAPCPVSILELVK